MNNSIKQELNNINSLNNLYDFVFDLQASEIGLLGGRKFSKANREGEIALNEILRKFDELVKKSNQANPNAVLGIRREIYRLDKDSNRKLNQKNIFIKCMTIIRSVFGSPAKTVSEGLFARDVPKNEILQDIGYRLPNGKEKSLYLLEEIFDELSRE